MSERLRALLIFIGTLFLGITALIGTIVYFPVEFKFYESIGAISSIITASVAFTSVYIAWEKFFLDYSDFLTYNIRLKYKDEGKDVIEIINSGNRTVTVTDFVLTTLSESENKIWVSTAATDKSFTLPPQGGRKEIDISNVHFNGIKIRKVEYKTSGKKERIDKPDNSIIRGYYTSDKLPDRAPEYVKEILDFMQDKDKFAGTTYEKSGEVNLEKLKSQIKEDSTGYTNLEILE